ncbi:MAG: hypothetical protein ABJF90_17750, partial [Lentilitoribacter sp.]
DNRSPMLLAQVASFDVSPPGRNIPKKPHISFDWSHYNDHKAAALYPCCIMRLLDSNMAE